MGSCFSCTREEAPAPAPTVAPGKTSCQKAQWEESKWRDDTKAIWGRCLGDLPVHMDLPRLANRMRIVNRHGKEVSEVAGDSSRMEIVRAHLRVLATELGEDDMIQAIETKFYEYAREDGGGDFSQQLLQFLREEVGDNSRLGAVLRACHQKMVFPSFYHIKNNIFDRLPFKDQRGTWRVAVYVKSDRVEVRHRKTQVSRATATSESDFEFDWELRIQLDERLEQMTSIKVIICDLRVLEGVSEAREKEIRSIFEEFYEIGEQEDEEEENGEGSSGGGGEESDGEGDDARAATSAGDDGEDDVVHVDNDSGGEEDGEEKEDDRSP